MNRCGLRCGDRLALDQRPSYNSWLLSVAQLRLDLLDGREAPSKIIWKPLDELGLPLGDGDGLGQATQSVLDYDLVLRATEQEPDGGLVVRVPKEVVSRRKVQIELSDERRLEGDGLELDDNEASEHKVIEEQVEDRRSRGSRRGTGP